MDDFYASLASRLERLSLDSPCRELLHRVYAKARPGDKLRVQAELHAMRQAKRQSIEAVVS